LEELIRYGIDRKIKNCDYKFLTDVLEQYPNLKEIKDSLFIKEKQDLEKDREMILAACKGKKYLDKNLNVNTLDYIICPYILDIEKISCYQILRWLKGPVIKMGNVKQRNIPRMYGLPENDRLDLLYYIIKEDNTNINQSN
jgi:hypothetical protein